MKLDKLNPLRKMSLGEMLSFIENEFVARIDAIRGKSESPLDVLSVNDGLPVIGASFDALKRR